MRSNSPTLKVRVNTWLRHYRWDEQALVYSPSPETVVVTLGKSSRTFEGSLTDEQLDNALTEVVSAHKETMKQ